MPQPGASAFTIENNAMGHGFCALPMSDHSDDNVIMQPTPGEEGLNNTSTMDV